MKNWLLTILFAINLSANPYFALLSGSVSAGGGGNITADVWEDFELSSLVNTELDAHDHASGLTWTPNNGGSTFAITTSGELATISTVNSSSDTGTKGVSMDLTKVSADYINASGLGNLSTASFAFWVKTPNNAVGNIRQLFMVHSLGNAVCQVVLSTAPDINFAGGSSVNTLSQNTWYWVTVLAVKNGTCKMRIYTSSGVQVGSEKTASGGNFNINEMLFGSANTSAAGTGLVYFDDMLANYSATYPLGP